MSRRNESALAHDVEGEVLHLSVQGSFDFLLCPEVEAVFEQSKSRVRRVVVDCRRTNTIDSSALGMLLFLQHQVGDGRVQVAGARGQVQDTIRRLSFDRIFQLTDVPGPAA